MMKIFCDACGNELPKPGSKKSLLDIAETKFGIDGRPSQEKKVYCEDCTPKILEAIKNLKPIIIKK